jgi:probable F420-dependent oxidoreductase
MHCGVFLSTHGVTNRDDRDWWHQPQQPDEMKPVESAQLAEALGFHSVWMGDHVALPEESPDSISPIHVEGVSNPEVRHRGPDEADVGGSHRHYPARPTILDGAVVMGAIAAATKTIRMGPGVLISPYRHPLNDLRQFATIDVLSGGRLIFGVGCGWMKEEFEVLGHPFHSERMAVFEECLRIYRQLFEHGTGSFDGRFYSFENVGVFPLSVQRPRPPIVIGANAKRGARFVARYADGIMPILTQPQSAPSDARPLTEEIRREAERCGRATDELALVAFTSFRISGPADEEARRRPRRIMGGSAEQILEDIERFAAEGFSVLNMAPICPSRTHGEFCEQISRFATEVLPAARAILPQGPWRDGV